MQAIELDKTATIAYTILFQRLYLKVVDAYWLGGMSIEFKRFKLTDEMRAWLLSVVSDTKQELLADLKKYKKDGVLPNTAGMLTGCNGVGEMRFHFGAGYRIYFCRYGDVVLLLLNGGDKDTQTDDIKAAQAIKSRELKKVKQREE